MTLTAPSTPHRPGPGSRAVLLACLVCAAPAAAAPAAAPPIATVPATETFGPGKVNCQVVVGQRMDCLLSASRITSDNRNEASFSLAAVAPGARALLRAWCLHPDDECIVTLQGRREAPQATRLATVSSLRWHRPRAPTSEAAAALVAREGPPGGHAAGE